MPLTDAILDAGQTAAHLPWAALVHEIAALLNDDAVEVPARLVQALPGGGSLFVMPALDSALAIAKLITFTPGNSARKLPAIQGDVVVFDVATGRRRLVLDGPAVTARRTAAVSALAATMLAPNTRGPLLIVGAGVQGKAHLEAFASVLGIREVMVSSRSASSARALAAHAETLGLSAHVVADADAALADCPLVVTCTPASAIVLKALPRPDAFLSAVGAFTPGMVELGADLCRHFHAGGRIVVDSPAAVHEAGDLLQAGLDVAKFPTLAEVLREKRISPGGPVLFKSCGWAGWDLAAARAACRHMATKYS